MIKLSAGTAVSGDSTGAERSASKLIYVVVGSPQSLTYGLSIGLLHMVACFPQSK